MPTAHVNGVKLWYEQHGMGLPLLFIHGGYGGAASTLVPQEQVIVSILPHGRVETITYDRRNAGRSEYVLAPFTLADLVEDAAALRWRRADGPLVSVLPFPGPRLFGSPARGEQQCD
jgi:pimeloyl-ACP methyl ester carboxylesterase